MRTAPLGFAAAVALALSLPAPALAGPAWDASEPPQTEGPLLGSPVGCEDNGVARPDETRLQMCTWSYDLVPAEANVAEDYHAHWIQIDVDPAGDTCIFDVYAGMSAPPSARMATAVPASGRTAGTTTVELSVDAEGAAPVAGSVAQDVHMPRGRVTTELRRRSFSFHWQGSANHKVVFAMGIQIAGGVPPELMNVWSESMGVATGPCRPLKPRTGR